MEIPCILSFEAGDQSLIDKISSLLQQAEQVDDKIKEIDKRTSIKKRDVPETNDDSNDQESKAMKVDLTDEAKTDDEVQTDSNDVECV